MTSWRVCHLDMLNLPNVFVQCGNQISLHTLHVVDIVLVLEIRAVHLSKKLYCFVCVCEEVARSLKDVESFDHHIKMSSYGLISSPGQILPYPIHLRFTALPGITFPTSAFSRAHPTCCANSRAIGTWVRNCSCRLASLRKPRSPPARSPASKFIKATASPEARTRSTIAERFSSPGHQNSTAPKPRLAARSNRSRNGTSLKRIETLRSKRSISFLFYTCTDP